MPMPLGMGSPINSLPFDLENALYEASKIRTRPVYVDLLRMPEPPSAPRPYAPPIPSSPGSTPAAPDRPYIPPYNPNIDRNSEKYRQQLEKIRMIEEMRKKKRGGGMSMMEEGASLADVLGSYV